MKMFMYFNLPDNGNLHSFLLQHQSILNINKFKVYLFKLYDLFPLPSKIMYPKLN